MVMVQCESSTSHKQYKSKCLNGNALTMNVNEQCWLLTFHLVRLKYVIHVHVWLELFWGSVVLNFEYVSWNKLYKTKRNTNGTVQLSIQTRIKTLIKNQKKEKIHRNQNFDRKSKIRLVIYQRLQCEISWFNEEVWSEVMHLTYRLIRIPWR